MQIKPNTMYNILLTEVENNGLDIILVENGKDTKEDIVRYMGCINSDAMGNLIGL